MAVIGCGLIGKRRVAQISKDPEARLELVVDVDLKNCEGLGSRASSDWNEAVRSPDIDALIISTPNHLSAPIAIQALYYGKDVLIEKPFGMSALESKAILSVAKTSKRLLVLKTGFNHRFHPAIMKAKEAIDGGRIGSLLSIRARYGHGGRAGMEKEWRASKTLCGGGELLDQGIHLIDLIQWFGGEFKEVYGMTETKFWEMSVEDNAFVIGKTAQDVSAMFHVSWTNWKNIFSFELFGTHGYIHVEGLGGNYGPETFEIGIKKAQGGRPNIEKIEYSGDDISWELEWKEFKEAILERRQPLGNGEDGLKANQVIEAVYKSQREKKVVYLHESAVS